MPTDVRASDAGASGRDRTVDALVAAAIELFGERGPDAVSLREVASHAGVNYGLIHQYVGSKDDLIRLVLRRLSEQSSERLRSEPRDVNLDRLLTSGPPSASTRLLTWAILQRREGPELLSHSPALDALTEAIIADDADLDPLVARRRAVSIMATVLGWQLYGDYLLATSGLGADAADDVSDVLAAMLADLLGDD